MIHPCAAGQCSRSGGIMEAMKYLLIGLLLIWASDKLIRYELIQVADKTYLREWLLILVDAFLVMAGVGFVLVGSAIMD